MNDMFPGVTPVVHGATQALMRRYWKYVEREDLLQELWVWVCQHPSQIEEKWPEEYGEAWLTRSLMNAGRKYAEATKAEVLGYSEDDLYYWQHGDVEEALKSMFDWSKWVETPTYDDEGRRKSRPPNEGGNWIASLADVSLAFESLDGVQKDMLRQLYGHGYTQKDVAKHFNVRQSTISEWKSAAIRKLHEKMGGHRPWKCKDDCECGGGNVTGSRRVMSNAEANAKTGSEYSGD